MAEDIVILIKWLGLFSPIITQGTIEERILKLHGSKRDLADSLLEGTDRSGKLTTKELLALIK